MANKLSRNTASDEHDPKKGVLFGEKLLQINPTNRLFFMSIRPFKVVLPSSCNTLLARNEKLIKMDKH